ncbi:MAG: hypothetical protein PHS41_08560, partial [Victivallaceae bacterium]|nr:hypothetical protein [Victivallaceae bacterium]
MIFVREAGALALSLIGIVLLWHASARATSAGEVPPSAEEIRIATALAEDSNPDPWQEGKGRAEEFATNGFYLLK